MKNDASDISVSSETAALRSVELAGEVGFCFGVRRAIHLTRQVLDEPGPVYILGDLVHNRNVTDELEAKGLRKVPSTVGMPPGTMVVRAHGLPQDEVARIRAEGFPIVDATCPIVHRAQEAAQLMESRGCQVIIIGDADHAEIKGIMGALTSPALVIDSIDDLRKAKASGALKRKVGVIFQTTHALELCKEMIGELVFMCKEVQIINTICRPVRNRQDDAVDLAERVDLMLVVGSATSANTMELAALCRAHNAWTKHIEGVQDLTEADLAWAASIGIASGLSTPVDLVQEVRSAALACTTPPDRSLKPDASFYAPVSHGS